MAFLFAVDRASLGARIAELDAAADALAALDPNVNPALVAGVVGQLITHVQALATSVHHLAELLRKD